MQKMYLHKLGWRLLVIGLALTMFILTMFILTDQNEEIRRQEQQIESMQQQIEQLQITEEEQSSRQAEATNWYVKHDAVWQWTNGFEYNEQIPLESPLQEYIYGLCKAYDVSMSEVITLIDIESDFHADLISPTNDYGLMQINQSNHKGLSDVLGITNFLDPYQNVYAGIYMLSDLQSKYEGHQVYMAYNMGEGGMQRAISRGAFTSIYSRKVFKVQEKWQTILEGGN